MAKLSAGASLSGALKKAPLPAFGEAHRPRELAADVAVIGGGLGGCAAALAALRRGATVVLTEETDWLGGQVSQQAVPPDEHARIESVVNPSYRAFREAIRGYYRAHYPLKPEVAADPLLNPGKGKVSRICTEPRLAAAVLEAMLMPWRSEGRLTVLYHHRPAAVDADGDAVRAVRLHDDAHNAETVLRADVFLDATETGELLPLAGCEYVTGAEGRAATEEPHAPEKRDPLNMQAVTHCFAMEWVDGEDFTIDKPDQYAFWRDYVPEVTPAWPGTLLSWVYSHPPTLKPYQIPFHPTDEPGRGFWLYRRIRAAEQFQPGHAGRDATLVNWPMNDYVRRPVFEVSEAEREQALEEARQLSLSWFYWLQTEAPRDDGKTGWPGLRLRPDLMGTRDGLAKRVYIRESRRIQALYTVREQDVGKEARMAETGASETDVRCRSYDDSIGVGSYRLDLHPSTGGDNYIDFAALPFEIPLGALVPVRMRNLLPACKNIGTTHVTNGCYRLHPVEWAIGDAAGLLAVETLRTGEPPQHLRANAERQADFLRVVDAEGIPRHWPDA